MERSGNRKGESGVKLPGTDIIVVVHRSEGSGTTYVWTDYLSKVSPEWKTKVGTAAFGELARRARRKGNEGVAGQIQQHAEFALAMSN